MGKVDEIIDEIKEQEDKSLFKSRRQREKDLKRKRSLQNQITNMPFHIQNAIKITGEHKILEDIDEVMISGVGVNSAAGNLLKSYLDDSRLNFGVNTENELPPHIGNKTLVFILSFSGDELEAISCYKNALRKGCRIIGITQGGKLGASMKRNNTTHLILPENISERAAIPYLFFPMLGVLENSRLIKSQKKAIDETIKALKKPEYREFAERLCENISDRSPAIFSSSKLSAVSETWKMQFNMTAKRTCHTNTFPGLCYSELDAYEKNLKDHYFIILRDTEDDQFISRSMAKAKEMIRNRGNSITEILIKGKSRLSKLFSAINIGDWSALMLSESDDIDEGSSMVTRFRKDFKAI